MDDVKEAVAKWNLRPDIATTVANDEDTTTYDIVYQGETLTGVTNAQLLALWTAVEIDPSEVDTAVGFQEGVVTDAQQHLENE